MDLWTVQDAARELKIDQGYLRKMLKATGIPGVEKLGRQWQGSPQDWRRWDNGRQKRRRHR